MWTKYEHIQDGVLVVDKPPGPTSHDIVKLIRKRLKTKAGHTGTLDPLASGVLPLTLGRATRLTQFFQSKDKEYLAEFRLGKTTDTLDRGGKIITESAVPVITPDQANTTLAQFTGKIRQQAPLFSAVRVKGKRLYDFARKNQQVSRPWRTVYVHSIQMEEQRSLIWKVSIHCSSGTYIRSLASDIGAVLGCGAYLHSLRRIRSGSFKLSRSTGLDQIENITSQAFFPMEKLLKEFPRLDLNLEQTEKVNHGAIITWNDSPGNDFVRLFYAGQLIAIAREKEDHKIHPIKVLKSIGST